MAGVSGTTRPRALIFKGLLKQWPILSVQPLVTDVSSIKAAYAKKMRNNPFVTKRGLGLLLPWLSTDQN
jgi:hypothetical protein